MCPLLSVGCIGDTISECSPGISVYFRFLRFLLRDMFPSTMTRPRHQLYLSFKPLQVSFAWALLVLLAIFAINPARGTQVMNDLPPVWNAGFSGLVSLTRQWIYHPVHGCDFLSWIKSRLCQYFAPELALKFDWEFFLQHFPDLVWASKISSIRLMWFWRYIFISTWANSWINLHYMI